jgi:hypothetical protein
MTICRLGDTSHATPEASKTDHPNATLSGAAALLCGGNPVIRMARPFLPRAG